MLDDQQTRHEALNTQRSFIVQAPAGSGKTELLTQRFLKLLSVVNSPEEIVAITFTRKAAAQMRQRIHDALLLAHENHYPQHAHKQVTFHLAREALKRDQKFNWHIIDNPNRLRVLTIDALAGFISAQIPILAGFGSKPQITDNATALYEKAARELIASMTHDTVWKPHLETLLLHLDNNATRVIELLCAILAKREQWLPHIIRYHGNSELLHQHLEHGLAHIVTQTIQNARAALDPHLDELVALAKSAANQLANAHETTHSLLQFLQIDTLTDDHQHLTVWQALATLLLTQKGELRKTIDKRHGFSAKSPEKERLCSLLNLFAEAPLIQTALTDLHYCPGTHYPVQQKAMIDALTQLLPILYAQLRLVFQETNAIDFIELNLAALRALGEEEEPTDLALYLDYQIQHLLIDEFQDTSITQYSLLERLTRGWEAGDGRSLFVVGDPMQSIYRFRDAEVGLFIRAQSQPINTLHLKRLTLQNNYRSDHKIIDWINTTFSGIFPSHSDSTKGAVPYCASVPTQSYSNSTIECHGLVNQSRQEEASLIVDKIKSLQAVQAGDSIAILVRSRNQLRDIIQQLYKEDITFHAVDLETLLHRPEIQDLVTLTRVTLHREDRIAWYALLRSPICGLTLNDLHYLSQLSNRDSLWHHIQQQPHLSEDGQQRLRPIQTVLSAFFSDQGRKPFELALKGLWRALGFESLLDTQQRSNCAVFFELIAELATTHKSINVAELTQKLSQTYITPQQTSTQLSIMTIHKSKGLEFDHVILPGLNSNAFSDKHELMLWLERANASGSIDFILAPIKHASKESDPIYRYLQRTEQCKLEYETARLLYVAATRAKKSLHLSACIQSSDTDTLLFKNNSFANLLKAHFIQNTNETTALTTTQTPHTIPQLTRVPSVWQSPIPCPMQPASVADNPLPQPDHPMKRIVGTVIHEMLATPSYCTIDYAAYRLRQYGMSAQNLPQALDMIELMLVTIKTDPRAQWILSTHHLDAHNEYPVSTLIKGRIRHLIIDRTFIDNNTRWIIDYKTATPDQDNTVTFLNNQLELYQEQLVTYRNALLGLKEQPIRMGLYFPICGQWIEIPNDTTDRSQSAVTHASKST